MTLAAVIECNLSLFGYKTKGPKIRMRRNKEQSHRDEFCFAEINATLKMYAGEMSRVTGSH